MYIFNSSKQLNLERLTVRRTGGLHPIGPASLAGDNLLRTESVVVCLLCGSQRPDKHDPQVRVLKGQ